MPGPLTGVRVLEIGGIGPVPFAGMMLADLGAEVTRVDREELDTRYLAAHAVLLRGRRSVALDLKSADGVQATLALAERSDVLLEGFRPGVMERLGLGPDDVLARNPRLVYGRMTGWGQTGPYAGRAGHDITYLATSGALEPIVGQDLAPALPLNMLGDFAGGSMMLVSGVLAALLHSRATGQGQVVDAAIVDGAALMTAMLHSLRAAGAWPNPRGQNLLDGGAPFYDVYQTSDNAWLAVGPLEPLFYAELLQGLELHEELGAISQYDTAQWPTLRTRFAERIAERTAQEWTAVFADTDACAYQVVPPSEVMTNPHLAARETYVRDANGVVQPAPAPRFSATPTRLPAAAPTPGADTELVLAELNVLQVPDSNGPGVEGLDERCPTRPLEE